MVPHRCLSLLLALALPACTDKGDDTEATGAATDTDAATDTAAPTTSAGDLPAGCACAATDPCDVALCETVEFVGETEGSIDEAEVAAAVDCALAALRDGKAGTLHWTDVTDAGQFDTHGRVQLFGDGKALRSFGGVEDLCMIVPDQIELGPLQAAEFFTGCMAEVSLENRFDCVKAPLAMVTEVCQEAQYECDDF